MGIGYYLIGHTSLLAFFTQKLVTTLVGALIGLPIGWVIAKTRLLPAWLAHYHRLIDLLDPESRGGIGEHTRQLAEINSKLDDLHNQPRT